MGDTSVHAVTRHPLETDSGTHQWFSGNRFRQGIHRCLDRLKSLKYVYYEVPRFSDKGQGVLGLTESKKRGYGDG